MGILIGSGALALALGERNNKPSRWTSHATFTFGSDPTAAGHGATGTYTAADSTVPPGIPGNAEIDLGMGLSGNEKDFSATIGVNPNDDTNVSQFVLGFDNYHGAGSYPLTSTSHADLNVTVRNFRGNTDTWGMEHSTAAATCAVRVAADAAMRDPSIRRISGTFACRGLYDTNNHTSTTTLRAAASTSSPRCGAEARKSSPAARRPRAPYLARRTTDRGDQGRRSIPVPAPGQLDQVQLRSRARTVGSPGRLPWVAPLGGSPGPLPGRLPRAASL